jgi:hypothetical protein
MHYMLRTFLISCSKANNVPIIKKLKEVIKNIRILKGAIYIKDKIMDFWQ